MENTNSIPGFHTPRKGVLTSGNDIIEEQWLYDWEAIEKNKGRYPYHSLKDETDGDLKWILDELHPVRFTKRQIEFLEHMIRETGIAYWEEECLDIISAIEYSKI